MTATYSLSLFPESNPEAETKVPFDFFKEIKISGSRSPDLIEMSLPSNIENKEGKRAWPYGLSINHRPLIKECRFFTLKI